jgi:hypothetical protein
MDPCFSFNFCLKARCDALYLIMIWMLLVMVKIFSDMELSYNPDQSHEIYGQECHDPTSREHSRG